MTDYDTSTLYPWQTHRRFWCGALLALAAGCAPPPERTIEPTAALAIGASFTASQARVIAAAAEGWSWPTHGWVSFSWSPDGYPILPGSCSNDHDACQTARAIYVTPALLAPNTRPQALYCAVQHELGHALGLPHSPDPSSIMAPELSVPCQITPADAQAVVDL